jgi:hypothetical protein
LNQNSFIECKIEIFKHKLSIIFQFVIMMIQNAKYISKSCYWNCFFIFRNSISIAWKALIRINHFILASIYFLQHNVTIFWNFRIEKRFSIHFIQFKDAKERFIVLRWIHYILFWKSIVFSFKWINYDSCH